MSKQENRFLHGGDYNPDQWLHEPEILKQDLEYMKMAKVNTVTVGVFSWSMLEPQEGHYQFDWLDKVFDDVYKMGGNVILATPSGGRPQWMSEKYEEVNRVDEYGRRHHHGFRHNHCYSSPVYREKVKEINTILAKRYGHHPALLMWHVSNEYSGECYCEHCQENWRQWVKNKYKTLDNLNQAWWTHFWSGTYTSWSQVVPPSPLGETKSHGMDLDWKRFNTDMTIDFFKNEIEPLKKITPHIPVTTNFMAEGQNQGDFIPLEGIDYSKFSKYVDIVSWDSYPDWHNQYESLMDTAMKSAYVHDVYWSLKKQPFLVMECTPSVVNWGQYNKSKRPGMHILSSMQQIAHGSDSTLYFQWRQSRGNSEKFHGAVVGHDNSCENRVFKEVAKYGERLEKIHEIKGTGKDAKVAIICDWQSNWALKRGGGFGRPTRRYMQTLQEHYSVFWKQDITVEIVRPMDDLSQYSLVIAPMLYMINEETMIHLQNYVSKGGILISTYFTGMVNDTDLLYVGGWPKRLQNLFGIDILELEMLYPNEKNIIQFHDKSYETKDYCAIIKLKDAVDMAQYQNDFYAKSPAITKNKYGDGVAYFMAPRMKEDFLFEFYADLIQEKHLANRFVKQGHPEVSVQKRVSDDYDYYFIMNFSSQEHSIEISKAKNVETNEILEGIISLKGYEVIVVKVDK